MHAFTERERDERVVPKTLDAFDAQEQDEGSDTNLSMVMTVLDRSSL